MASWILGIALFGGIIILIRRLEAFTTERVRFEERVEWISAELEMIKQSLLRVSRNA